MKPASAIARRTTLRRSFARSGLLNGESRDGDWMTPAIVAASLSDRLVTSFEKNSRAGFRHAVDRERAALAERDVVQIQRRGSGPWSAAARARST